MDGFVGKVQAWYDGLTAKQQKRAKIVAGVVVVVVFLTFVSNCSGA